MAETATGRRFSLRQEAPTRQRFAQDVLAGLTADSKSIPPRYFYDDLGSALFTAICALPEYYLTRAETEILTTHGREIAAALDAPETLVELGNGSSQKTRILLDHMAIGSELEYVPLDVDASLLAQTCQALLAEYPSLTISAVAADFERPSAALRGALQPGRRTAVVFLGSTIGNLDPGEAGALLGDLRQVLRRGEPMLLGADLRKPEPILQAAYDDALGVTAAFNRNVLQRVNRELGGHFDVRAFAHRAFYDAARSRVEMHLVSLRDQRVRIDGVSAEFSFAEGESIHTESSYKYDEALLASIAAEGGFELTRRWTDSREWFGSFLLRAR